MSIIKAAGAGDPSSTGFFSYKLNQSLRFPNADSGTGDAYLNRTPSSASNRRTWTWSAWVKRSKLGSGSSNQSQLIWAAFDGGDADQFRFGDTNDLEFYLNDGTNANIQTNQLFRDVSAWYHIVLAVDTTQSTASSRVKFYVNGEQITSFSTATYPSQNYDTDWNSNVVHAIGQSARINGTQFFCGYLGEINFIDGAQYDASYFGETVDGVWVAKSYSGSYGTNGFYLSFANSSLIGDDLSGNTNDWTANNLAASDVVPDSPTNNFATWNPLDKYNYNAPTEGALRALTAGNNGTQNSTFAVSSGKWYWEARNQSAQSGSMVRLIGIAKENTTISTTPYNNSDCYLYYGGDGNKYNGGSQGSYGDAFGSDGDIVGVAFDADNGAIWFSKNGTWQNSATASEIAAGTTTNAAFTGISGTYVMMVSKTGGTSSNDGHHANFGQDSTFSGQITAGGNSDSKGIGDFAYAPPSGFLALCTSNLPDITIGPGQSSQADSFFETMLYTGNGAEQHIGSGGVQHPQDTITIANSLKFNHADSSFLSYQPGANGATKIMTYSGWIKLADTSKYHILLQAVSGSYDALWIEPTNDKLQVVLGSTSTAVVTSTRKFIGVSKWYHICVNVDTTQSTASDRIKIWIDGVQETLTGTQPAQDATFSAWFKSGVTHRINFEGGSTYGNGYIAEVHVAEGTAYDYTYFGQVGSNGYWIPKNVTGITYGDEGFHLDFADSSAIGDDESGNTNDFTATNTAATDVTIDSPTQNFSTLDPTRYSGIGTFSQGNLTVATTTNNRATYGTIAVPSSGKWYYEIRVDSYSSGGGAYMGWGTDTRLGDNEYGSTKGIQFSSYNEQVLLDGTGQSGGYGSNGTNVASNGDVYSVLLDVDNGLFYYAKNGTYFNSANPSNGTGGLYVADIITNAVTEIRPILTRGGSYNEQYMYNFGQDPSFNGGETAPGTDKTDANGVGKFLYDVPTGFLALMDDNIPVEGIASPDFVWIKERSGSTNHYLFDTVRGVTKNLHSNSIAVEATDTDTLLSFDGQGFTVGSNGDVNGSTDTYVAWNWKAGGVPTADNSAGNGATPTAGSVKIDGSNLGSALAGSLAATRLSANTTAGFSIVIWDASGVSTGTMAHGLTVAPDIIIAKARDHDTNWFVQVPDVLANTHILNLETTGAAFNPGVNHFNDTVPTDEVFSFGGYLGGHSDLGGNTEKIAYCFHGVEGYSKFGSYTGNFNADGPFIYTGFRPAFLIIKRTDSANSWLMRDNKRDPFNVTAQMLSTNSTTAEYTDTTLIDFVSNGFKLRHQNGLMNASGGNFIYLCFAEAPFKFANAR